MEVTYRFVNNWNERLQYFSNIEFDIGYPARHKNSSTIEIRNCNTLATMNLILGTQQTYNQHWLK